MPKNLSGVTFSELQDAYRRDGYNGVRNLLWQLAGDKDNFPCQRMVVYGDEAGKTGMEIFFGHLVAFGPGLIIFEAEAGVGRVNEQSLTGLVVHPRKKAVEELFYVQIFPGYGGSVSIHRNEILYWQIGDHNKGAIIFSYLKISKGLYKRIEYFLKHWLPIVD